MNCLLSMCYYKFKEMKFVFIGVVPVLLLCMMSCNAGNKKPDGKSRKPENYNVLKLVPIDVTTHMDFPASIQGQQVVEIRPKIDGYIDGIFVKEGAIVKKGQLLFRISNPQYEQMVRTAEASIKIAEADVLAAEMNVNKVKPLVEKDIVSKFELQSAQYTLQSKEAILAQAKASLANARTNLGYTSIQSPLDGVIGNIPYKIGALVNSNNPEPLTTLSDNTNVHVYFSLNEKKLLSLTSNSRGAEIQDILNRMSSPVLVLADGSEYPEKGKLETASGLIATETGTVSLKAIFPNTKGVLRSGASAIIRLPHTVTSAFLIPQSASYELLDKRFIYAVGDNNKVFSVPITSTSTDDGQFFIVNEGLKTNDRIVLTGITRLKDSIQIIPVMTSADSVYKLVQSNEIQKK
jgi:membrane fusion protein, multidrug efflux system